MSKLSMKFFSGCIVGTRSFLRRSVVTKKYSFTFKHDSTCPFFSALVPRDTFESTAAIKSGSSVSGVVSITTLSKVVFSVIKSIVVFVVCSFSRSTSQKESVHPDSFTLGTVLDPSDSVKTSSGGVPISSPVPLRYFFKVLEINKRILITGKSNKTVRWVRWLRDSVPFHASGINSFWHFPTSIGICGAAILALFLFVPTAFSQSTTLSGTVADTSSQQWANGTFQLTFQPNPTIPQGPYTWTGGTLPTTISGVLNGTGAYSVSVPSNSAISPIGTGWNLQVCPQATSPCFSVNNLTIGGATQVFNVTPPAISISLINPPSSPMLAYSDSEISSAVIGSFYLNIPILNYRYCQAVTGQTCTAWNGFGSGPPPTGNPRLDQVLNQNQPKTFNQGGASLGFTAGPGLNLSGETSPLTVPVIVSCTTAAPGQICDDGTNYHIFVNGVDTLLVFSSSPILSGNNGDVAGYKVVSSQVSLQDLGPVNANTGNTFINIAMTAPLDEDVACWNASGPPFWINCTPGAQDSSINGATNSRIVAFADQLSTIDHDTAGSAAVTVTLPTAITLGLNPGFLFSYSNHSTKTDLIVPTTWTINGSPSLTVPPNVICNRIRVDPFSATNWLTECATITGHVNHGLAFSIGIPGGTALTAASTTTDYLTVPFACTINSYNLAIDAGTITVKFWKVATGTAIPTSGNSINTSGVSIASGTAIHSTTLTDFTSTSVLANDIMAMNVTAVATAAFVNGVLSCAE